MNNHCIVISKLESFNRSKYVGKIFYIEDYISVASIADARRLTDEIFKHNEAFISKYDYEGLKITWSWYSEIFQFCIKYLEIERLMQAIDTLNIQHLRIGNISPQYRKVLEVYFS